MEVLQPPEPNVVGVVVDDRPLFRPELAVGLVGVGGFRLRVPHRSAAVGCRTNLRPISERRCGVQWADSRDGASRLPARRLRSPPAASCSFKLAAERRSRWQAVGAIIVIEMMANKSIAIR